MINHLRSRGVSALVLILLVGGAAIRAQEIRQPEAVPLPPRIAAPLDRPFPGTIGLLVDITDTQRHILNVHETVPVQAGELTLLYPEWLPGNHSPTGPIARVTGLAITDGGKQIAWMRDRVDVYAFHVAVPAGVNKLEIDFQYLDPVRKADGRISFSSKIADLQWNTVVLYPAGHFSRIVFSPSIRLPEGWQFASALEVGSQEGSVVHFKDTPLNTLVDSPLYAGANFKRLDLSTDFDASPGREWRPLADTTNQPIVSQRTPVSWVSWQRAEEYYMEGLLIWLDADTKIRELSGDKKSLDDSLERVDGVPDRLDAILAPALRAE